jgi:Cu-Zn family superoxide dismutase
MCRHTGRIAAVVLGIICLLLFGRSSLPNAGNQAAAQQPARRGDMKDMKDMKNMPGMQGMKGMNMAPAAKEVTSAVCVLIPLGDSKVKGKVTFTKKTDGVGIAAQLSGLTPGDHGFHIHEFGDISSPDGLSAGGHFNPANVAHGNFDAATRHEGDFGNITADAQGNAVYSRIDKLATLSGPNSIIGRAIIVHANKDDFSQPVGNAGGRIAAGVIGIANPAPPPAAGTK